jgi:hypothetical protein
MIATAAGCRKVAVVQVIARAGTGTTKPPLAKSTAPATAG